MKNTVLLIFVVVLSLCSIASAQTFSSYVSSMRGDTAVLKDYAGMGNAASSLTNALKSDSISVPAGRVYMLITNGYYPLAASPTTSATRPTVIVGQDFRRIVGNQDGTSAPPVICGSIISGAGSNTGSITWQNNLTVKNCNVIPAASDGTLGWSFFNDGASGKKVYLENCLFERTRWIIINSNNDAGTSVFINDCYFVNLVGQACRRNGGVYDNVNNETDTMWVENSTHVMAQGSMYKFRNFAFKKAFFNHNTFVNCAGSTFETLGYQSNMVVTNNIFVNSNLQPFDTCLGALGDLGEIDADNVPTGLINCKILPSTMTQLSRKYLIDNNVVYWDSKFNDMVTTENTAKLNGDVHWQSQMITMNTRTQAMFDDNVTYPYLTEGRWYKKLPTFKKPLTLLTAWTDSLKAYALGCVSSTSSNVLTTWRVLNPSSQYFVYSDWPIPVDLSYSDADLMAGGTGGFPVGDLNWFPARKTAWLAQVAAEHTAIETALNTGKTTGVAVSTTPATYALNQNYPNPFNPSTTISFSLSHSANVSLKVFDMLGREVATLVNGFTTSGSHEVQFDATNYASGIYFYKLTSDNFTQMKKMMLVK